MPQTKRSGGPKTEAGKARSSQNARKHGLLCDKVYLLENEDPKDWEHMKALCYQKFRPRDEYEQRLVDKIASARWRLDRIIASETAILAHEMDAQGDAFNAMYVEPDEYVRTAVAFQELADKSKALELLQRYEAHLERSYQRSVKALFDLRAQLQMPENQPLNEEVRNELDGSSPGIDAHPNAIAAEQVNTGVTILRNEPESIATGAHDRENAMVPEHGNTAVRDLRNELEVVEPGGKLSSNAYTDGQLSAEPRRQPQQLHDEQHRYEHRPPVHERARGLTKEEE
jgi:hypothetical protein